MIWTSSKHQKTKVSRSSSSEDDDHPYAGSSSHLKGQQRQKQQQRRPLAFSPIDDALDCERPSCDDMVSKLKQGLRQYDNEKKSKSASTNTTATAATGNDKQQELKKKAESSKTTIECPPFSSELGRSSWTLLHTMAAWYPDEPTDRDRDEMTNFLASFARYYPCPWCAADFQTNLQKKPVRTTSRKDLCIWLCEQHNLVNEKLGKDTFKCDLKTLDERWRKSSKAECKGGRSH